MRYKVLADEPEGFNELDDFHKIKCMDAVTLKETKEEQEKEVKYIISKMKIKFCQNKIKLNKN